MRFALVDISNLMQRAKYAASGSPDEQLGLTLLIVFRSLRKLHTEFAVEHIVFAADRGSWRTQVYPGYKSRRRREQLAATPREQRERQEFFALFDTLLTYLQDGTRCTVLSAPQIEGDDFIARWIERHPDDEHIIVSADSDFVQLIADNVLIYDAVNQRMLTKAGVVSDQGKTLAFQVSPKNGMVKVGKPEREFSPEPEWWRKALFIKLIRGDASDSVFSAYPGVRYEGKKCSIRAAWEDRGPKGYDWNNLMCQTWDKLLEDGAHRTVRVLDEFRVNESLIDLTKQPDEIKARMDAAIEAATAEDVAARQVGQQFLRFCDAFNLPVLVKEASDHVAYLNKPYRKRVAVPAK